MLEIKVTSDILYQHWRCHFSVPQYGHLSQKEPELEPQKHNGIRACICCYMAGAPSDMVGLLELWNQKT